MKEKESELLSPVGSVMTYTQGCFFVPFNPRSVFFSPLPSPHACVFVCVCEGGVNVRVYVPWPECGGQRAASDVGPHIFHLVCGSVGQAAAPPASRHSRVLLLTLLLEPWACRCVLP